MKIENAVRKCPFARGNDHLNLTNYITGKVVKDVLHNQSKQILCKETYCHGAMMSGQSGIQQPYQERSKQQVLEEATQFLGQYFSERKTKSLEEEVQRLEEVKKCIEKEGTYELTEEELLYGAKLGWRNAARCIGRIQWNKLKLQDGRGVKSTQEMFQLLCEHLKYATNEGNIRSMITIFPQRRPGCEDYRVWNPQLLSFAGYLQQDGSIVGDPGKVQFTRVCQRLGWKGKNGKFDILPWVLYSPHEGPHVYDIPEELVLRIHLEHPTFEWFRDLNLQWYSVPAVADMLLDVGGVEFPACPFNGWYMGTEVGGRDLCDPQRYNIVEEVGAKMGLDMSNPSSLWKDKVLVEVNLAVLYSYQKNGVTIVDHHTASDTFMKHVETEQKQRGGCPADWVWIVPPMSGNLTSVFHQEMVAYYLKPSYEYQEKAWKYYKWPKNNLVKLKYKFASLSKAIFWACSLMKGIMSSRKTATILYATETGKSETLASRMGQIIKTTMNVRIICMEDYKLQELGSESFVVVIASTFGNGEAPDNGKTFWKEICHYRDLNGRHLKELSFAVFALGSSQYPTFCAFGKNVDAVLGEMGCQRIIPVGLGDELQGQEQTFNQWAQNLCQNLENTMGIKPEFGKSFCIEDLMKWHPQNNRVHLMTSNTNEDVCKELSRLHSKKIVPYKLLSSAKLQARHSPRQTILVRLGPSVLETAVNFLPGDHLGVFPSNPSVTVEAIIKRLHLGGITPDDVMYLETFDGSNWIKSSRLPPCSVRTALTKYLDVTTPPSAHMLLLMSGLAKEQWDSYRLKRLSKDIEDYEEWKWFKYPNLAEVLEEFHSVHATPEFLLTNLPLLQPRYYSISSSPLLHSSEIHLTVVILNFKSEDGRGKTHRGVCSNYLNSFPDENIPVFVRSAPDFRMPSDPLTPILMIGAGSGIAPFRSFWTNRDAEFKKRKYGEMVLFFGCRQRQLDVIYEQETSPLVRKGVFSRVFNVFSREPGMKKKYVQDAVLEESKLVKNLIDRGAHIYVCGDATMSEDVKTSIKRAMETEGDKHLTDEAEHVFNELRSQGRYHEDVFGIVHRRT